MKFKHPIQLQVMNKETEQWTTFIPKLYANINKAKADDEYFDSGAVQTKRSLIFQVRFRNKLKLLANNTQLYRIVYDGHSYDITDYDDFQETHKTVKLLGVSERG